MPSFDYQAVDSAGKKHRGKLNAADEAEIVRMLRTRGMYPEQIRASKAGREIKLPTKNNVTTAEVALLARQLESIIGAGVSVEQSIAFVAKNSQSKAMQDGLRQMLNDIRSGSSIADAARKHPKIFDGFFVGMLEAGQATGNLESVLGRVGGYYERQAEIRRKVSGAMIYPSVIFVAGIVLLIVMMAFVVPQFVSVIADLDAELPAATKVVMAISSGIRQYGIFGLIGIGIVGALVGSMLRTPSGKLSMARFMMGVPLFGDLMKQQASSGFASSLAFATDSGLNILDALDVARESVPNEAVKVVIDQMKIDVQQGTGIHEAIRAHGSDVFDPLLADMAAAGVEAGEMTRLLDRAASFFESNVDSATESVLKAIEPILILFIGGAAGGVVVALFSPIISLTQSVSNM